MIKLSHLRIHHILPIITLISLTISLFLFLYYTIQALVYPYQLDLGEAQVIDQAIRISRGISIYQPDLSHPPYTVANYPPVYMALLSPFVRVFGANFWSGRLISILSTILCAVVISLIMWQLGHHRMASIVSAGVFLAFPTIIYWSAFVRVDMLGLLFSLVGLLVFLTQTNQTKAILYASLLFCLAVYTRQSLGFTAPATILIWLIIKKQWRSALLFSFTYGLMGIGSFILINILTKGGFYVHAIQSNMSPWHNLRVLAYLYLLFGFLFFGIIYLILRREWFKPWTMIGIYFLMSTLTAMMVGKIGSNVNYLNEFVVGISFLLGTLVAISGDEPRKMLIVYSAITVLVIVFISWSNTLAIPLIKDRKSPATMAGFERLRQLIRSTDGPVLADEYMGAIVLENRPIYIQTFDMTQLSRLGLWDQTPFLEEIKGHKFPLIIITNADDYIINNRWTPEMLSTIKQNYQISEQLGNTTVYAPPK